MMKKMSKMFFAPLVAILLPISLALGFPSFAYAGQTPDTPERVMNSVKSYNDNVISRGTAITKRVFSALSNDRKFAGKFLELVQLNDKIELVNLIAKQARVDKQAVKIEELDKDMLAKFTVEMPGGTRVSGCVDTEDGRCGGKGWSVSVSGK